MSKQLAKSPAETPTKDVLLKIGQMLLGADALQRLLVQLCQTRTLVNGAVLRPPATFHQIGNTVVKISTETRTGDINFNWAANSVSCAWPQTSISISSASEEELAEAERFARGGTQVQLRKLREFMRASDEQSGPLQIEIVNPRELMPRAKITKVKRGDDGKITGLVTDSVIEPS